MQFCTRISNKTQKKTINVCSFNLIGTAGKRTYKILFSDKKSLMLILICFTFDYFCNILNFLVTGNFKNMCLKKHYLRIRKNIEISVSIIINNCLKMKIFKVQIKLQLI